MRKDTCNVSDSKLIYFSDLNSKVYMTFEEKNDVKINPTEALGMGKSRDSTQLPSYLNN